MEGEALKDEAERADAAERARTTRTQFGALCWRVSGGKPQILLVTSRGTGRWIVPKGWPIDGLAPHEAAAREAWEEAGVRGDVGATCLGLYPYIKVMEDGPDLPCTVALYPIRVRRLADDFPEARSRPAPLDGPQARRGQRGRARARPPPGGLRPARRAPVTGPATPLRPAPPAPICAP